MSIKLIELRENSGTFENDEIEAQNLGDIDWANLTEISTNNWKVDVSGVDVSGHEITPVSVTFESATTPTPSQIFIAIANAIRATLCPECGLP